MADEAFALSPISARAALPSEADYDAIREAFMETSRGRWFLGEYAKRNRNADTAMVLDAVARIEDTLAAQKRPVRDPLFDEALASLRAVLGQAREAANAALADLALEENLAPMRKGTRVIREIAWRLREIGADGRICDLIDSQVSAIEGSAGKLATAGLASALGSAFDRIEAKIAAFDAGDATASPPPPAEASPSVSLDEAPAPVVNAPVSEEAVAPAAVEAPGEPVDAFDAHDEALLDMVAMEMGAPDTDTAYEPRIDELHDHEGQAPETGVHEAEAGEPPAVTIHESLASYELDVTFPDSSDVVEAPVAATSLPAVSPLQPAPEPVLKSEPKPEAKAELKAELKLELKPAAEPSLGSSLLASGIVSRPRTKPDPLAPIRRMSQTEKIAFFS
jgi:hypothetical protein